MKRLGRLRRSEFETVYHRGERASAGSVSVRREHDARRNRLAVVAGRRTWARAVDRNRVRRRLRAAATTVMTPGSGAVVVIARRGAERVTFAALQDDIRRALERSAR
jgi:ribonuclease P protein component